MPSMRLTVHFKRQNLTRPSLAGAFCVALGMGLALPGPVSAQAESAQTSGAASVSYPVVANLTLGSDVVLTGAVRKMSKLAGREALSAPEGFNRYLMTVSVTGVLLAPRAVPGEITYVWDAPEAVYGKRPKLKNESVLLFLRAVPGNDRTYQLAAQNAQIRNPDAAVSMVRSVASDPIRLSGFGHRVTGVVDATRLQRASDESFGTHFLIETASKGLMTVSVTEGAGADTRTIRVSLPDTPEESRPLERNSLPGYFLACGLPPKLPEPVLATAAAIGDLQAVQADYTYLRETVGPCQ